MGSFDISAKAPVRTAHAHAARTSAGLSSERWPGREGVVPVLRLAHMYVYIYIYMYTRVCVHVYMCVHVYIYTHICVRIHLFPCFLYH